MVEDRGSRFDEALTSEEEQVDVVQVAQADTADAKTDRPGRPDPAEPEAVTRLVAGEDRVVELPSGTSLEDIRIEGDDLVLVQPDGSVIIIVDGAIAVPTFVMDSIEIPRDVLIAAMNGAGLNVAAGPDNTITVNNLPQGAGADFNGPGDTSVGEGGLDTLALLGNAYVIAYAADALLSLLETALRWLTGSPVLLLPRELLADRAKKILKSSIKREK